MEKEHLVGLLIAYWTEGPAAVDEESRRVCREVAGVLARSMSGVELLALQEAPEEHRREIEARVAVWLAMTGESASGAAMRDMGSGRPPRPAPEPVPPRPVAAAAEPPTAPAASGPGLNIRQKNQGGINLGNVGTVHGGLSLAMPAPSEASRGDRTDAAAKREESQKIRILFLGANPADSSPLRLDEEVRAIDRALVSAALGGRCELAQKWAVRVGEIQEHLLRTKPQVVHFSGHGHRDRSIVLQGDDGLSRPVAADRLARLLARFNQRLRCVVLNACYTREHGEAIAEHIDCVVGMSTAVADRAAIRFSSAFYLAVASGCSVQDAFEQALADIELGEMGGDEVPALVARRCDPAEVFLIKGG
ncbi:MAG TPA: CHAT domain-containing protein [Thermoanaerobaculia bacterium]